MAEFRHNKTKIKRLIDQGVTIPNPDTVLVADEVEPYRIANDGVVIHSGCKLLGASTFVANGVQLGMEAPVCIQDCQIGPEVQLKGGSFKQAVFLKQAQMGSGAHVREGTILEEQANGAHAVGLKQTILFPFVTLGSLINFCDCLMAGGTDRKNHSEVGSSYIHFNYTPHQDKATPTLLGDVPRGVMLKKPPIFLGGQGGIVGPCRLNFGTVIAAGTIQRRDESRENRLIFGNPWKAGNIDFVPGQMAGWSRVVRNNINYIGNLIALRQWYQHVRAQFIGDDMPQVLLEEGLWDKIDNAIEERIKRLGFYLKEVIIESIPKDQHNHEIERLNRLRSFHDIVGLPQLRDQFLESVSAAKSECGNHYLDVIKNLKPKWRQQGTKWLKTIVEQTLWLSSLGQS
jgi:UDP-N-acetylglucosamine/UDP-N-acetylgalactosamine diphosphorylase